MSAVGSARRGLLLGPIIALGVLSTLLLSAPADEKHVSTYSAAANYMLPVTERDGRDYVGLFEILEPLGKVSIKTDGLHWKLRYHSVDSEFTTGKTRARIQGRDFDLPATFLLERRPGHFPRNLAAIVHRQRRRPLHCSGQQDKSSQPGHGLHIAGEPDDCH
ncbi:MAG: hypothetical protein AUG13_00180 [Chloroflexi bacterium 13_1_20CM_2_59_7]|nr:MAG: hypothetical protein AUG13_00180 [Chloroflexi bacterium 13_1_20CM_2_59_7]